MSSLINLFRVFLRYLFGMRFFRFFVMKYHSYLPGLMRANVSEAEKYFDLNYLRLKRKYNLSAPFKTISRQVRSELDFAAILTTFNQSTFELQRSFDSLINQSVAFDKIIIFDGGSTSEETIRWIYNLESANLESVVVHKSKHCSIIDARNTAAKLSGADFFVFLDPDDWLHTAYLEHVKTYVGHFPSIDIIYPDVKVITSNASEATWKTGPFKFEALLDRNCLPLSSFIRSSFFFAIGGFSSDVEKGPEDWDLWIRASIYGARALHLPLCLFINTGIAPGGRTDLNKDFKDSEALKLRKRAVEELAYVSRPSLFPL
jgi:glycosyltransferase involved in cell wall biosynthesis